jgi:hypothetical protein
MLIRVIVVLKDGKPAYFVHIPVFVLASSAQSSEVGFRPATQDKPDRWTVDGAEIDGNSDDMNGGR